MVSPERSVTYRSLSLSRSPSLPIHRPNHSFLPLPDHGISPHTSHTPQLTTAAHYTFTAHSCVILHDFRLISLDYTARATHHPLRAGVFSVYFTLQTTATSSSRDTRERHTYTRSYTVLTTHIYDSEEFTLERVAERPRIFTVFYAFTQRRVGLEWERGGGSGGADGSRHGSYDPSYSDRR